MIPHTLCATCFLPHVIDQPPHTHDDRPRAEVCCACGAPTMSGIHVVTAPFELLCRDEHTPIVRFTSDLIGRLADRVPDAEVFGAAPFAHDMVPTLIEAVGSAAATSARLRFALGTIAEMPCQCEHFHEGMTTCNDRCTWCASCRATAALNPETPYRVAHA